MLLRPDFLWEEEPCMIRVVGFYVEAGRVNGETLWWNSRNGRLFPHEHNCPRGKLP